MYDNKGFSLLLYICTYVHIVYVICMCVLTVCCVLLCLCCVYMPVSTYITYVCIYPDDIYTLTQFITLVQHNLSVVMQFCCVGTNGLVCNVTIELIQC